MTNACITNYKKYLEFLKTNYYKDKEGLLKFLKNDQEFSYVFKKLFKKAHYKETEKEILEKFSLEEIYELTKENLTAFIQTSDILMFIQCFMGYIKGKVIDVVTTIKECITAAKEICKPFDYMMYTTATKEKHWKTLRKIIDEEEKTEDFISFVKEFLKSVDNNYETFRYINPLGVWLFSNLFSTFNEDFMIKNFIVEDKLIGQKFFSHPIALEAINHHKKFICHPAVIKSIFNCIKEMPIDQGYWLAVDFVKILSNVPDHLMTLEAQSTINKELQALVPIVRTKTNLFFKQAPYKIIGAFITLAQFLDKKNLNTVIKYLQQEQVAEALFLSELKTNSIKITKDVINNTDPKHLIWLITTITKLLIRKKPKIKMIFSPCSFSNQTEETIKTLVQRGGESFKSILKAAVHFQKPNNVMKKLHKLTGITGIPLSEEDVEDALLVILCNNNLNTNEKVELAFLIYEMHQKPEFAGHIIDLMINKETLIAKAIGEKVTPSSLETKLQNLLSPTKNQQMSLFN